MRAIAKGELYWRIYINVEGVVEVHGLKADTETDYRSYANGNGFMNHEEADEVAEKIRKILKGEVLDESAYEKGQRDAYKKVRDCFEERLGEIAKNENEQERLAQYKLLAKVSLDLF